MVRERLDREDVRLGQIEDVYVVTNARAVGSRVVVTKEIEMVARSEHHVQGQRNEMYLGDVSFGMREGSARGVEVAQRRGAQPSRVGQPVESLFDHSLGLAIGALGSRGTVLVDGHL